MNDPAQLLPWLAAPLEQALGRRAHALLIHGPNGVGQFELGWALAQAWLCESSDGRSRACGHCAGCHLMRSRAHPDFLLLVPDALREAFGWSESERDESGKKAKPSREIRVEAVRDAIAWAQQTSSRGRAKVLLIHPAQTMNAVTANALLKTLEEPPAALRLVLCTSDPELLLPTVRSRCQRLRLAAPERAAAIDWLQNHGVDGADVLLAAAGGQPLDALALAEDGINAATWQRLPKQVSAGDAAVFSGWAVPRVIETLQKLCHDAMAVAAGGAPRYFDAGALPPAAPIAELVGWSKNLTRIALNDEHPWQAPLLIEALVSEAARTLASRGARETRFDTLTAR